MNRRQLLLTTLAAAAPLPAFAAIRTQWKVRGSEGFDALCFLGPLAGKPLYTRYYETELAEFRPRFPATAQAALDRLQTAADAASSLLAPGLCTMLSAAPDATLDEVILAVREAETRVLPAYRASEYWNQESWDGFLAGRADLLVVLGGLREAGFPDVRRRLIQPKLEPRIAALSARLATLDVIAEQERLIGRKLEPGIEIVLLWFSKPHGVRIQGQRFLSHVDYPDALTVRIAGHEILHPPFPMEGPTAKAAIAVLDADPLLVRVLKEHDPAFGYNTMEGILNEDTVQALDQIIAERLGVAIPPAQRWAKADDGMHILAAGLYGTLKAEGYDRTGGDVETWMAGAVKAGKLGPARLHAAASKVLEVPVDQLWPRPKT
ncbi:MAG: hypothetical protein KKE02_01765 [Alphaproteobacteria bacterium]|nr:hypothetical protein [Alphaproteobacteria bacterium]MBU1514966.1 hypothetical protein [Alphaproteobacteria bacterium]MBU2095597.1 hypothetical protein [Alphaproteobacteria bacterium]MBU2149717.1 hypothetical protein [Alphaproteobacteria bacterium]MBU2309058.1 hypothetical protein [Alphaproteobacteria bacterium]